VRDRERRREWRRERVEQIEGEKEKEEKGGKVLFRL
jgi:hypothetical protein